MSRVACPHCGFMNFDISAYCGRCERPLPRAAKPASEAPPPAFGAAPVASAPVQPAVVASAIAMPAAVEMRTAPPPLRRAPGVSVAASGANAGADVAPSPINAPPPQQQPQQPQQPPAPRPAPSFGSPLASVPPPPPPPLPPPAIATVAPPPAPIELSTSAIKKGHRSKSPRSPNIGDFDNVSDAGSDPEVPVTVPTTLRLALARSVDGLLVCAVGIAAFLVEATVAGTPLSASNHQLLDRLAELLSLHLETVVHATVVAMGVACLYSVICGLRSGQTLGRLLTDTVIVRRSGKPFNLLLLCVRSVVGVVSAATFGAGFFWSVIDPYHRTWHDVIAGTVTVRRHVRVARVAQRAH